MMIDKKERKSPLAEKLDALTQTALARLAWRAALDKQRKGRSPAQRAPLTSTALPAPANDR